MTFNPMKHRIPILKRLVPSVRKRLARARALNGFTLRACNGAVFLLNSENFVDRQIAFYDDFETGQTRYLFDRMQRHGCDLFIDVGANIGFYCIPVALRGLAAAVLAFEPDERNRLQLGANILINRVIGKITVSEKAVSSASGTVTFRPASDTSTGQSRIDEGEQGMAGGGVRVSCVALDDVVALSGRRIFIKMDIEGHELSAIRGMKACATRNKVFLQVESFAPRIEQVATELSRMGLAHLAQIDDDHYFSNF
jgi:FkbM family methyltransferase